MIEASFAHWFGGADADGPVETVSMDVRPGGSWSATMYAGPDRREIQWSGIFGQVSEFDRLAFTLWDRTPEDEGGEPVTVTFAEVDGGTEMVFRQIGGNIQSVVPRERGSARARSSWAVSSVGSGRSSDPGTGRPA